ncbi:MAG TPA: hypothetical protein VH500_05360 [Nitrososphaeraceae archaeon]
MVGIVSNSILILSIILVAVAILMVDFWGLWASALTVAVGIVEVGIMIWYELRKQNSKFEEAKDELNNMNGFLHSITVG